MNPDQMGDGWRWDIHGDRDGIRDGDADGDGDGWTGSFNSDPGQTQGASDEGKCAEAIAFRSPATDWGQQKKGKAGGKMWGQFMRWKTLQVLGFLSSTKARVSCFSLGGRGMRRRDEKGES